MHESDAYETDVYETDVYETDHEAAIRQLIDDRTKAMSGGDAPAWCDTYTDAVAPAALTGGPASPAGATAKVTRWNTVGRFPHRRRQLADERSETPVLVSSIGKALTMTSNSTVGAVLPSITAQHANRSTSLIGSAAKPAKPPIPVGSGGTAQAPGGNKGTALADDTSTAPRTPLDELSGLLGTDSATLKGQLVGGTSLSALLAQARVSSYSVADIVQNGILLDTSA